MPASDCQGIRALSHPRFHSSQELTPGCGSRGRKRSGQSSGLRLPTVGFRSASHRRPGDSPAPGRWRARPQSAAAPLPGPFVIVVSKAVIVFVIGLELRAEHDHEHEHDAGSEVSGLRLQSAAAPLPGPARGRQSEAGPLSAPAHNAGGFRRDRARDRSGRREGARQRSCASIPLARAGRPFRAAREKGRTVSGGPSGRERRTECASPPAGRAGA
jgi:hypothetical protein